MKAKLHDLINSIGALEAAGRMENHTALATMTLGLVMRAMRPYIETYNAARQPLLEKYAELVNPKADMWQFTDSQKRKAFDAELAPVLDLDCELAGISPVPASKWEANGVNWSAAQLLTLEWLVPIDTATLFDAEQNDHDESRSG